MMSRITFPIHNEATRSGGIAIGLIYIESIPFSSHVYHQMLILITVSSGVSSKHSNSNLIHPNAFLHSSFNVPTILPINIAVLLVFQQSQYRDYLGSLICQGGCLSGS